MEQDHTEQTALVARVLTDEARSSPRLGTELASVMRERFPSFDYREAGFRSFTHMLDSASELSVLGHRGTDFVWGIANLDTAEVGLVQLPEERTSAHWIDDVSAESIHYTCARFQSYKGLRNLSVPISPFTVIIGANGVGKTSVLEGIFLLSQLRRVKPPTLFQGRRAPDLLHSQGEVNPMRLGLSDAEAGYSVSVEHQFSEDSSEHRYSVRLEGAGGEHQVYDGRNDRDLPRLPSTPHLRAVGATLLLQLDARRIAKASWSDSEKPTMRHDGFGLPSVLADLASTEPEKLENILDALRKVVPSVQRVRMPRVSLADGPGGSRTGHRLEVCLFGRWLDADLLSEGTLLMLALFTFVYSAEDLRFVLVDDLDRALHPKAQGVLVDVLKEGLTHNRGLRVVATSHSPYLLDRVPAESVLVMRQDEDGWSSCAPLVSHPDWAEWKGSLEPGEFWSHVGEGWLDVEH